MTFYIIFFDNASVGDISTCTAVVETLLENDNYQCLTSASPPIGDLVSSVLEIEKSTLSGGEESGMFLGQDARK